MNISTEATKAPEKVHKNVDISPEASKAYKVPQNVHKDVDISIKATKASENLIMSTKMWIFRQRLPRPLRPPKMSTKM